MAGNELAIPAAIGKDAPARGRVPPERDRACSRHERAGHIRCGDAEVGKGRNHLPVQGVCDVVVRHERGPDVRHCVNLVDQLRRHGEQPVEIVGVAARLSEIAHLLHAARVVMLDGLGVSAIVPDLAYLGITTFLFLGFGAWSFRWRVD